ncbi:hypothetical protein [Halorientalis sp.]|uniref:hypothetical protein n=1 Tax=Halorientalis sp. TaxID=1931229 RepID=UPI0039C89CC6
MTRLRHPLVAVAVAVALTVPWVATVLVGAGVDIVAEVALSGVAILGASFLLAWGAETAEKDVPRAFAIAVLVNKARSTAGFNALISSKLNQWTLLVGTIAVVYSLALGAVGTLPFDSKQAAEIWITAAQSFFALALLIDFEISTREAVVLFILLFSQVALEFALVGGLIELPVTSEGLLFVYTGVYLLLGVALFIERRGSVRRLFGLAGDAVRTTVGREPADVERAD